MLKKLKKLNIKKNIKTVFNFIIFLLIILDYYYYNNENFINYNTKIKDNITLVSAYFKIKSKHSFKDYKNWIKNFLKINSSMVFFVDKSIYKRIINKRPKNLQYKTIWIKTDITEFFTYKRFFNEFKQSYKIDNERIIHSVYLYLIWAEKCYFLKTAVLKNYFKSKCFYWVDAGCFREKDKIRNFITNWPSSKECFKDGRVIFNEIRKPNLSEKIGLKMLNLSVYKDFQNHENVDGSIFGGKNEYIIKFIDLYYNIISLLAKNKLFIGKDQNLFAYLAYFHSNYIKLIYSGEWFYLQKYLSKT